MNLYGAELAARGMSAAEATAKEGLFSRTARALPPSSEFSKAYFVPGRIEVLGKHTDYAGGRSLLCAAERGFCLIARRRPDRQVNVIHAGSLATCQPHLDPGLNPSGGGWSNYVTVVVRRMARNFPFAQHGADIAFLSDLPEAAGMSSSSALMIAVFLALADVNEIDASEPYRREIKNRQDLAGYLGTVENGESFGTLAGDRGVGTFGGSEDHTAILCSRAGELGQYQFCPIRHERSVPIPEGYLFAVAVSGVTARKTGEARDQYNRASLIARRVLEVWNRATGRSDATLSEAASHAPGARETIRSLLLCSKDGTYSASKLCDRFDQFVEESFTIVPSACESLAAADLRRFGELVDDSQKKAEILLANQVPETIELTRSARTLGAYASSAFGAGFGGSVWALVRAAEARDFLSQWEHHYRQRFPSVCNPQFLLTRPGPAAMRLATEP